MRRLFIVLSVPLLAGCPSQETICKKGVDQVCEREFECQPQAAKDSDVFKAAFGTSVAECKTLLYANPLRPAGATGLDCTTITTDQQLCTNLGIPSATTFDLSNAGKCKEARADLACADYLSQVNPSAPGGTAPPTICSERCKP